MVVIAPSDATPDDLPTHTVLVDVANTPVSRPVPDGFIGFSIEYPSLLAYAGADPAAPNPAFIRLVRALNPSGPPVIRIGGDTTDWTWWPVPGLNKPKGIRYTLTPRWLVAARAAATAMGARLILGINLEANSSTIARAEAQALERGIGRNLIAGFELGNEPEVYGRLAWYINRAGAKVRGRPRGYGFGSYLNNYAAISAALPRDVPLVGPASGSPQWAADLNRYLAANPRVRIVTFHRYPLHRCFTRPDEPTYPTIPNLLAPAASSGPASVLQAAARIAHAHGLPLRADELNSVSCAGKHGVSDTFASALWILDTLFNMAKVGVDGVNIHTFTDAVYRPFSFTQTNSGWKAQIEPMYYGMLMFARAAPAGSRILQTTRTATRALRIWATKAPDGTIRVAMINDSPTRTLAMAIRPPRAATAATLERLKAPTLASTTGMTIASQTIEPSQQRYVVQLPPGSAALLETR